MVLILVVVMATKMTMLFFQRTLPVPRRGSTCFLLNGPSAKLGRQSLDMKCDTSVDCRTPKDETSVLCLDARHFRIASRSFASAMPRQASLSFDCPS